MSSGKQVWGGKRHGAGRPKGSTRKEPTVVKRIPRSRVGEVEALLNNVTPLRVSSMLGGFFLPTEIPVKLERPLFASQVSAGFPSPADDYIECGLDLNEFMVVHPSATYFVRVSGDSMIEAGIFNGDYLVVDRAIEAFSGAIVVAILDGELTVKRLYRKGSVVELRPENASYQPIHLKHGSELLVWGVVSGVFRKF
jgi:DNA polymerase V